MTKAKSHKAQIAGLKILKKKGLYSGDLRKKPTRYALSLLKKHQTVVMGSAKVVKVNTKANADKFKQQGFSTKGKYVIIENAKGDKEKIYFSKRLGTLARKGKINEQDVEFRTIRGNEVGGTYWLITPNMEQVIGNKEQMEAFVNRYIIKSPDISSFVYWDPEGGHYADIPREKTTKRASKKKSTKKK